MPGETVNAPGSAAQRGLQSDRRRGEDMPAMPRTLSHVVYFVPDVPTAEAFYVKRLASGHRPLHQRRAVPASRRHAGPSHAVLHPDAAVHEGLRAFHLPFGRPDRADARRHAFRRQGLSVVLGAGPAQVRLELVLVFQQPARLPCRIRRRHGPARRRMDAARHADEPGGCADLPVRVPRKVGAWRSAAAARRAPVH